MKVLHLNDSKGTLGSALDRHDHVGMGNIGAAGFRALLHHGQITSVPMLMEVPEDGRRSDKDELAYVRKLIQS